MKMRVDRRKARQFEKAKADALTLLVSLGEDADAIEAMLNGVAIEHITREKKFLQAEGMLLHLSQPSKFAPRKCKECEEVFTATYKYVAYCSDPCRGRAMERTGIIWNYAKDHYANMRVEQPMVIGPAAYKELLSLAQDIVNKHNVLIEGSPQEAQDQSQDQSQDLDLQELDLSFDFGSLD